MNKLEKTFYSVFILLLICSTQNAYAKEEPDKNSMEEGANVFANQALLFPLFEKLYELETNKGNKVNIVHIGDSHIQADFFTNTIRQGLQYKFGNGGFGLTFPYSLIKTNGPRCVKYKSNAVWQSQRNVSPVSDVAVGLSGIALYTPLQDCVLQFTVEDGYEFNTVKVIYPTEEPQFQMSISVEPLLVSNVAGSSVSTGFNYHKVKSGESLSVIARKYRVTVAQLKRANGLKSNMIRTNQRLKIPVVGKSVTPKTQKANIKLDSMNCVEMISSPFVSSYTSESLLNRVTIAPKGNQSQYTLNGLVIENSKPGVIYHTIGVNGAQMSDYAKYPLFFKQLPVLDPDLIILSFGTNESFAKMSESEYVYQLNEFVRNIQEQNQDAIVLVMTPPPSMFRRTRVNTYISNYSTALMGLDYLPVWDLYTRMGGASGIASKGQFARMMDRRKVHYTVDGYQAQGELFMSDFLSAYNNFKKNNKTTEI
ncbi:LysM peptidoglycan-binding domain-containing protein [Dysgonomonas sp. Marseille-P4361]|uniref:LysM peptidoglycan-binding domain-containing protein n=1 Tax=Dysgonomonas sp. Marseille-P4361 TaxID=2161820 RepID=UPI000D556D9C|nr:LysM peptidoglycan-binding domain-containing protein [Dysgonomonas sp. Marseille-P4361]